MIAKENILMCIKLAMIFLHKIITKNEILVEIRNYLKTKSKVLSIIRKTKFENNRA